MSVRNFTAEEIKAVLSNYRPERTDPIENMRSAAVLAPFYPSPEGLSMVFTKRTERVFQHRGQISFPGGMIEPGDASRRETALRETCEEIGVRPDVVEVWGRLNEEATVTGISVAPYVGILPYPYDFELNTDEVDRLIIVPFDHLLDPANFEIGWHEHEGRNYRIFKYHFQGDVIWGATARMVTNLLGLLRDGKELGGLDDRLAGT